MRSLIAIALTPLVAACVSAPSAPRAPTGVPRAAPPSPVSVPATNPAPPVRGFRAPTVMRLPGLEGVIGVGASQLKRQFGEQRLEWREGDARILQFAGEPCVLDIYLYPLRPGATPSATHVEARRASDGKEVDRAACVRALRR